jgi:dihydroxyacetone kinase-like protein
MDERSMGLSTSRQQPTPTMKKLINRPEDVVKEGLRGLAAAHPDLVKVNFDPAFVYRADAPIKGKVALVSGGGSGHEPMHSGFVGYGMLDAACPGEVFTSPTPDQMFEAAKKVNGGSGVVYIVKNYSGDVMNFDMAAEMARSEGIEVESTLIADDVAVENSEYSQGRRGVGATVLAEKIAGAAAEGHAPLRQVAELVRKVNDNARSMGMALTSCTVPMKGTPTFDLGANEIEIGIGIHGERGRYRSSLKTAHDTVETMAEAILNDLPFKSGSEVLAFVNSMGGTPVSELYIVYDELARICEKKGIRITRRLIGPYITSLDMMGASITLLRLDDELTRLWDHPVKTPGLRWGM